MTTNHIFLYGPPGAGKTTVGQILAGALRLPFMDLDDAIETDTGINIPKIVDKQGVAAFRELEAAVLHAVVNQKESVIALGGGSLLRESNRTLAESRGKVVVLMSELGALIERLISDPKERPLLRGDLRKKLAALLAERGDHYRSFPLQVNAAQTPEDLVWQIQREVGLFHLKAMGNYDAILRRGEIDEIGGLLTLYGLQNPIIVTDENVSRNQAARALRSLAAADFSAHVIAVPPGETHKTLETVEKLWHGFLDAGVERSGTVVALGGGVIGDLAGFAASTYMRGIRWVNVPTTLLSMVDASLGGKTGFDLDQGKNLIGSFHPPSLVLADPQVLSTLPVEEFRAGLAEVVKHGIISDPELLACCRRGTDWIMSYVEEIIGRAMAVKIRIIEEDPYEKNVRAKLNLGHTVGHAVELVSNFQIRHGEAVAIGMVAESEFAERLGIASPGLSASIRDLLSALGLPTCVPDELPREQLIKAMRTDKKRSNGAVRFALPAEFGRVELVDIADLESVLEA